MSNYQQYGGNPYGQNDAGYDSSNPYGSAGYGSSNPYGGGGVSIRRAHSDAATNGAE
jgi:hypothetical protein